ncbi:hypothetical protein VTL71DRAFT_12343 [Oculimacula yallundae]|uniref:Uncharacterized protein n=1 Tax=Oculimacula yallundae TaxID=86028 RepID=A0ABR4CP44_9HELO
MPSKMSSSHVAENGVHPLIEEGRKVASISPESYTFPVTNPFNPKVGVESLTTQDEGDTWDDDFKDVVEMAFDPSNFQADDNQQDEDDNEDAHHEGENIIRLLFRSIDEKIVGSGDGAVESVERQGIDCGNAAEGEEDGKEDQDKPWFEKARMCQEYESQSAATIKRCLRDMYGFRNWNVWVERWETLD